MIICLFKKFPVARKLADTVNVLNVLYIYPSMPSTLINIDGLISFSLVSQLPLVLDNYSNGPDLHFWARLLPAVSEKLKVVRMRPFKSSSVFLAIRKSRFPPLGFLRKHTDMEISLPCLRKANSGRFSVSLTL